jgi:type VI secretion system protein
MFGGSLPVEITVAPDVNLQSPVAVELIVVYQTPLVDELRKLSARQWFERADDLRRDYPKGFDSWGYEWVPSQCVAIDALQYSVGAKAVVVFADYVTPGSHRAVLDAHQPFRLDLEREGFVLGEWGGGKPEERCVE